MKPFTAARTAINSAKFFFAAFAIFSITACTHAPRYTAININSTNNTSVTKVTQEKTKDTKQAKPSIALTPEPAAKAEAQCPIYWLPAFKKIPSSPQAALATLKKEDNEGKEALLVQYITDLRLRIAAEHKAIRESYEAYLLRCNVSTEEVIKKQPQGPTTLSPAAPIEYKAPLVLAPQSND